MPPSTLMRACAIGVPDGEAKVEFVGALGATSVIDYAKVPLPADGRFDVILDLAGNRPSSVLRKALAPRGTLVLGGGEGGDRVFGGMGRALRAALWSMLLKQRLAMLVGFVKPEPLQAFGVAMSLLFTLVSAESAPQVGLGIGAVLTLVAGLVSVLRDQPLAETRAR